MDFEKINEVEHMRTCRPFAFLKRFSSELPEHLALAIAAHPARIQSKGKSQTHPTTY